MQLHVQVLVSQLVAGWCIEGVLVFVILLCLYSRQVDLLVFLKALARSFEHPRASQRFKCLGEVDIRPSLTTQ